MDKKILIAEDEAIISIDLKRTLKGLGYSNVNIVHSASEAVTFALDSKPDLILMDINFNEPLNGVEAASSIKSKIDIPIIFVSAYSPDLFSKNLKELEGIPLVSKPVTTSELYRKINEAFNI
ncbi:MAG: response regulator [Ignavibacteria bacterium]